MLPDTPKSFECKMTLPTEAIDLRLPQAKNNESDNYVNHLTVEYIMPGFYLTRNMNIWTNEKIRSHGFTHIITIDKHLHRCVYENNMLTNFANDNNNNNNHINRVTDFSTEFETLDLNFGDTPYLTTVLPNCYKAVKFIDKALKNGGAILVIDCNDGEQKCFTVITGYLMYKHNISFSDAFARLKGCYKKADLDNFYISQLYEYEPILQVQRAQARGQSCSRELHSAVLKRKKFHDDAVATYHHHTEVNPLVSLTRNISYDDMLME